MAGKRYNQLCGLAYALDNIGERWTLLIIRELLPGPRRFSDLMDGLPGISTNLLTERLKDLEDRGLLVRRKLPPPARTAVYELTPAGLALEDSLFELGKWGSRFVPATPTDDVPLNVGSYALTLKIHFHPEKARGVDETYELQIDGEVLQVGVKAGKIEVGQHLDEAPDVVIRTDIGTYLGLLQQHVKPLEAIDAGLVRTEGRPGGLERLIALCAIPPREAAGAFQPSLFVSG
jgi:DNA-binding HxlR family transcriptional regulator